MVTDKKGFNVLTFEDKPGAVFTERLHAEQIANVWNTHENLSTHLV